MHPKELGPDAPSQCILLPADDGESAGAASTTEGVGVVGGMAEVRVPPLLAFGMREQEKSTVFEHLPLPSAEMRTRQEMNAPSGQGGGDGRGSRGCARGRRRAGERHGRACRLEECEHGWDRCLELGSPT